MPVRDRSDEFRQRIPPEQVNRSRNVIKLSIHKNKALTLFLMEVEKAHDIFRILDNQISEVSVLQSSLLAFHDDKKAEELYNLYDSVRTNARQIMNFIKDMQNQTAEKQWNGSEIELQICTMQVYALQSCISDYVIKFHNVQQDFKSKCKERITRQISIAGIECEDLEEQLEHNVGVFLKTVVPDMNISQQVISDVKVRHNQLVALERSIQRLHDLFFEVALIIERQAELMNHVDKCVHTARTKVADAKQALDVAQAYNIKAQKKLIVAVVCIVVLIVTIAILTTYA